MSRQPKSPNPLTALLLAAGSGTRLQPYTNDWPKCLMPINGRPLLEYWLNIAKQAGAMNLVVNLHYLADTVQRFLGRSAFRHYVQSVYEPELKGTAGTLRANEKALQGTTILLVHADNFIQCNFDDFLQFHHVRRPKHCPITMMTFTTQTPSTCGIVEIDKDNIVIGFHEKVNDPPGNLANGAVYLLEPEVLKWICDRPKITDFSTQVLPQFIGRIATWHNQGVHIDIGSIHALRQAQSLALPEGLGSDPPEDDWQRAFALHPIHHQIEFAPV
jgi:mannose-1-phosphate guanylyltransferase